MEEQVSQCPPGGEVNDTSQEVSHKVPGGVNFPGSVVGGDVINPVVAGGDIAVVSGEVTKGGNKSGGGQVIAPRHIRKLPKIKYPLKPVLLPQDIPVYDIRNPFSIQVTDKKGNDLVVGTEEFYKAVANRQEYTQETSKRMENEFNLFRKFTYEAYEDQTIMDRLMEGLMTSKQVDEVLSAFIMGRVNKKVLKKVS